MTKILEMTMEQKVNFILSKPISVQSSVVGEIPLETFRSLEFSERKQHIEHSLAAMPDDNLKGFIFSHNLI